MSSEKIYISRKSFFTALHYHSGELNEAKHRHDFVYEITLFGELNAEGFLTDFRKLADIMSSQIDKELSGKTLNEIMPFPTTENLAVYIYEKLKPFLAELISVSVNETPSCKAVYKP